MELDLLYEIDAPKPWPGKHPYGQKAVEQAAYREAIEQIKLADRIGFHTTWHVEHHFREGRSHSPAPVPAADARRGKGRDDGHPVQGPRRVGNRPVDADGADRLRGGPGGEPR